MSIGSLRTFWDIPVFIRIISNYHSTMGSFVVPQSYD